MAVRFLFLACFLGTIVGSKTDCDRTDIVLTAASGGGGSAWFNKPGNPPTYTVDYYDRGSNYSIGVSANAFADYVFDSWSAPDGTTVSSPTAASTTWTINDIQDDETITANFTYVGPLYYTLTVNSGCCGGSFVEGANVPISAHAPAPGKIFDSWSVSEGSPVIVGSESAVLAMPAHNVEVTATYVRPVSEPPRVDAGPDQVAKAGDGARLTWTYCQNTWGGWPPDFNPAVTLEGDVIDDLVPAHLLDVQWVESSGTGNAALSSFKGLVSQAGFSAPGVYEFELSSDDDVNGLIDAGIAVSDTVKINVCGSDDTVAAVTAQYPASNAVNFPFGLEVSTKEADLSAHEWLLWSGPNGRYTKNQHAGFSGSIPYDRSSLSVPTISFGEAGTYVVKVSASAGAMESRDQLLVTVEPTQYLVTIDSLVNGTSDGSCAVTIDGETVSGSGTATVSPGMLSLAASCAGKSFAKWHSDGAQITDRYGASTTIDVQSDTFIYALYTDGGQNVVTVSQNGIGMVVVDPYVMEPVPGVYYVDAAEAVNVTAYPCDPDGDVDCTDPADLDPALADSRFQSHTVQTNGTAQTETENPLSLDPTVTLNHPQVTTDFAAKDALPGICIIEPYDCSGTERSCDAGRAVKITPVDLGASVPDTYCDPQAAAGDREACGPADPDDDYLGDGAVDSSDAAHFTKCIGNPGASEPDPADFSEPGASGGPKDEYMRRCLENDYNRDGSVGDDGDSEILASCQSGSQGSGLNCFGDPPSGAQYMKVVVDEGGNNGFTEYVLDTRDPAAFPVCTDSLCGAGTSAWMEGNALIYNFGLFEWGGGASTEGSHLVKCAVVDVAGNGENGSGNVDDTASREVGITVPWQTKLTMEVYATEVSAGMVSDAPNPVDPAVTPQAGNPDLCYDPGTGNKLDATPTRSTECFYPMGSRIDLQTAANAGYGFRRWSWLPWDPGDGTPAFPKITDPVLEDNPYTIKWSWKPPIQAIIAKDTEHILYLDTFSDGVGAFQLTPSSKTLASGLAHGMASSSTGARTAEAHFYDENTVVSVAANPASGFKFDGWIVANVRLSEPPGNPALDRSNPLILTMDQDYYVTSVYTADDTLAPACHVTRCGNSNVIRVVASDLSGRAPDAYCDPNGEAEFECGSGDPGDLYLGDGDVDLADFDTFFDCWNGAGKPPNPAGGPRCLEHDYDGDGDVDGRDFANFAVCFNGPDRFPYHARLRPANVCMSVPPSDVNTADVQIVEIDGAGTPIQTVVDWQPIGPDPFELAGGAVYRISCRSSDIAGNAAGENAPNMSYTQTIDAGAAGRYLLTTASNPPAGGAIDIVPDSPSPAGPPDNDYLCGTRVMLTANAAAPNCSFNNWTGDFTGNSTDLTTEVIMGSDQSVTANFICFFTLDVTTSGAGSGTVTIDPDQLTYQSGDQVTLTATPAAGSDFIEWSGDLTGSANPATIAMDQDKTIDARFEPAGPGGPPVVTINGGNPLKIRALNVNHTFCRSGCPPDLTINNAINKEFSGAVAAADPDLPMDMLLASGPVYVSIEDVVNTSPDSAAADVRVQHALFGSPPFPDAPAFGMNPFTVTVADSEIPAQSVDAVSRILVTPWVEYTPASISGGSINIVTAVPAGDPPIEAEVGLFTITRINYYDIDATDPGNLQWPTVSLEGTPNSGFELTSWGPDLASYIAANYAGNPCPHGTAPCTLTLPLEDMAGRVGLSLAPSFGTVPAASAVVFEEAVITDCSHPDATCFGNQFALMGGGSSVVYNIDSGKSKSQTSASSCWTTQPLGGNSYEAHACPNLKPDDTMVTVSGEESGTPNRPDHLRVVGGTDTRLDLKWEQVEPPGVHEFILERHAPPSGDPAHCFNNGEAGGSIQEVAPDEVITVPYGEWVLQDYGYSTFGLESDTLHCFQVAASDDSSPPLVSAYSEETSERTLRAPE